MTERGTRRAAQGQVFPSIPWTAMSVPNWLRTHKLLKGESRTQSPREMGQATRDFRTAPPWPMPRMVGRGLAQRSTENPCWVTWLDGQHRGRRSESIVLPDQPIAGSAPSTHWTSEQGVRRRGWSRSSPTASVLRLTKTVLAEIHAEWDRPEVSRSWPIGVRRRNLVPRPITESRLDRENSGRSRVSTSPEVFPLPRCTVKISTRKF